VLDLSGRRLIVHRDSQDVGRYGSAIAYNEQESIAALAAPNSTFRIQEVFPK
jgi:hypothetical protein